MKRILFTLVSCLTILRGGYTNDSIEDIRPGNLFISNFSPNLYQGYNQNWDICEDQNGLIYVANGPLLEGSSNFWDKHFLGEEKYARSVFRHRDGGVLVGANEEFGIFERIGLPGEATYTSLMEKLARQYHSFGSMWQILESDSSYYLRAGRGLFKYSGDTVVALVFDEIVDYMQFIGNELYVLIAQSGLGKMVDDKFELLPFGDFFSGIRIVSIFPWSEHEFLVFTDDEGVYIADSISVSPIHKLNRSEIVESQISSVLLLKNGQIAIGTVKNGLFVLDREGRIVHHINKRNGLQNNTIISIYEDKSQNLWLGLDYGLSYVYLNSCLSILNAEDEIGTGYVSLLHSGYLYLGTNQGLYYTEWGKSGKDKSFEVKILPVNNTSGQVWNLHVIEGVLYCSHHKGLYKVQEDEAVLVSTKEGSWDIQEIRSLPGYYLQSTYRGLFIYRLDEKGDLNLVRKVEDIDETRVFSQDDLGYIWSIQNANQIFLHEIDKNGLMLRLKKVFRFDDEHSFERIRLVGGSRRIIFNTEQGFYTYNHSTESFEELGYYNNLFFPDQGEVMAEFFEDDFGRIWYVTDNALGYFSTNYGKVEKVSRPFNLVSRAYTTYLGKMNVMDSGNVLFGVDRGFYHFNSSCNIVSSKKHKCFISSLDTYNSAEGKALRREGSQHPTYAHKKNSFDFVFSSNIIESQEKVQFSFILEGYDTEWSEWSDRNSKEYSNLYEGTYTFKVKARDESGIESDESVFIFRVKPPFYRSIPAYIIYLLLFFLLIVLAIKYRDRKLEQQKTRIESEKQKEIEEKKKKYEEEQIKSKQRITELMNDRLHQDLKYKSQELSNSMINILHKNEILLNLKQEMQDLYLEKNLNKRDFKIRKLINVIDKEISTKHDLELFDSNFNAVHEEFLTNLKGAYPDLNQNDHRLCTFIKMNKSTKEIATFLNLSIRGVETSRYRLRKKMGLDSDENLYDIISSI